MKRNLLLGSALACLAVVWAASPAQAQLFRGGSRGASIGNGIANSMGFGNGYGYGYSPGYSYGNNWGGYGYNPGYSYGNNWGGYGSNPGYSYGNNWGTGWNNGYGYGAHPYYGSNTGTWNNGWNQNYNWSGQNWAPNTGYTNSGQGFTGGTSYTSQGFAGQQGGNNEAVVHVMVPAPDARVSFDGHETQQHGMQRTFVTAPLQQNGGTYTVRATWNENGKQVSRDRTVQVHPGQQAMVNFTEGQQQNQGAANQFEQRQNGNTTQQRTSPTAEQAPVPAGTRTNTDRNLNTPNNQNNPNNQINPNNQNNPNPNQVNPRPNNNQTTPRPE